MPSSSQNYEDELGAFTSFRGRAQAASDERFFGKTNFRDEFTGDISRDDLGLDPSRQFGISNDLNRLEVIAANEGQGLDRRLRGTLDRLKRVSDRTYEGDAVEDASARAARGSANEAAQFERSTRGMDLSDRQKTAAARRLGLRRSLNRAAAAGGTRRGFADRAKVVNAQGGRFSDALFSQRAAGETAIGQAWAGRRSGEFQERADKRTQETGGIATVAKSFFSSEKLKDDHGSAAGLLDKLKNVRVNRWNYKGDKRKHVGPFSEEFNREFGIDTDRPDMINVIDAIGVTLGAVKELSDRVEANA
jgi:hypothetical protein